MDIYQLEYVLHEPQESEGGMYLAEIPALQGAVAWGDTPEETMNSLLAVAQTIIQLRRERGETLPAEATRCRSDAGTLTVVAWRSWNGARNCKPWNAGSSAKPTGPTGSG